MRFFSSLDMDLDYPEKTLKTQEKMLFSNGKESGETPDVAPTIITRIQPHSHKSRYYRVPFTG